MAESRQRVFLDLPSRSVHFDADAFDEAVGDHGARFVHWRAMRCPVGLVDEHDARRPHEDHEGCSGGYLLTRSGTASCLFVGNPRQKRDSDVGMLDVGSAQLTVPRTYDDGQPVFLQAFDRMYLEDEAVMVPYWETVKHSEAGVDRLSFPALQVQDLVDWTGARYAQGADFEVSGGRIRWTGRRPPPEPSTGRAVYSVRYLHRPYWVVLRMLHELRLIRVKGADGALKTIRAPQACVVQREYVFLNSQQDPDAVGGDPARQQRAPESGGFGPR